MSTIKENNNRLSSLQLELLKSLKYMASEKQIKEVKSLLRFYFARQLDENIEKIENKKEYSAEVYEKWLENSICNSDI
ncbi:MAG TPA: hypothetical protein VIJ57_15525 [Hanamia sp.]